MWTFFGVVNEGQAMPQKTAKFEDVEAVNKTFRTFEERRRKLLELMYGKDAKDKCSVPTKWLDEDSLVAAQSLVDSHVAKFVLNKDGKSGELIRPRNWVFRRPGSIERLVEL